MSRVLSQISSTLFEISDLSVNQLESIAEGFELLEVNEKHGLEAIDFENPQTDLWGNRASGFEIVDNVTKVRINGMILRGLGKYAAILGACDIPTLKRQLEAILADPNVETVLLDIDSGGGHLVGVFDIVQMLEETDKTVITYTDGILGSASYKIASPSDAIFAGRGAIVGSVGTFMAVVDRTEANESALSKIRVIRSGEFKGAGIDGFTPEQLAEYQRQIDRFGTEFRNLVSKYRPSISEADMRGQVYTAEEAAERNFIDGLALNGDAALREYQKLTTR